MAERQSQLIIGCKRCNRKHREIRHKYSNQPASPDNPAQAFPAETAYTKDQLGDIIDGYTCPFCGEKLNPTLTMMKMITQFMSGNSHIISGEKEIEICSEYINVFIPVYEPIKSIKAHLDDHGMHIGNDIDGLILPNPDEDLTLLQQGMKDFDRNQWFIFIESSTHPEPLFPDEAAWFSLYNDVD